MALIDLKQMMQSEALQGIGQSEEMKQRQEMQKEQQEAAQKQGQMSAVGTGAMIGTQIMPGWGTVIGAAIGYLGSELF